MKKKRVGRLEISPTKEKSSPLHLHRSGVEIAKVQSQKKGSKSASLDIVHKKDQEHDVISKAGGGQENEENVNRDDQTWLQHKGQREGSITSFDPQAEEDCETQGSSSNIAPKNIEDQVQDIDHAESFKKVQEGQSLQHVDDPRHLFKCVKDSFGKNARICKASLACEAKQKYFHRRDAMEKHLLKYHGILTFIPGGFRFDDHDEDKSSMSCGDEIDDYEKKRCKDNFFNANRKYRLARQKFEKGLRLKGIELFNQIPSTMRTRSQDDFIQAFCDSQMKEYDSKKEERMQKINSRIAKGYEANTRDGILHRKENSNTNVGDNGNLLKGHNMNSRITKGYGANPVDGILHREEIENSNTNFEDNGNALKGHVINFQIAKEYKANTSDAILREKANSNINNVGNGNALKEGQGGQIIMSPNVRCSSQMFIDDDELIGSIEISYGRLFTSLNMQGSVIPKRFQFSCKRLNLSFTCSVEFLETLKTSGIMANTMTMNLFSLWLEYMLPLSISHDIWIMDPFWMELVRAGKSNQMYNFVPSCIKMLFIPTVHADHWTLWIIFNFHDNGIQVLKEKEGILYMDPLNNLPPPPITELIQEAVKYVWGYCGRDKVILKNAPIPISIPLQPNATDSGFYVMNCIRRMVEECLQDIRALNFGTGSWFLHEDVQELRIILSRWALRVVGIA